MFLSVRLGPWYRLGSKSCFHDLLSRKHKFQKARVAELKKIKILVGLMTIWTYYSTGKASFHPEVLGSCRRVTSEGYEFRGHVRRSCELHVEFSGNISPTLRGVRSMKRGAFIAPPPSKGLLRLTRYHMMRADKCEKLAIFTLCLHLRLWKAPTGPFYFNFIFIILLFYHRGPTTPKKANFGTCCML